MTLPAFIYARFSALEQGRGKSLVRQFETGRTYAEKKGWLLDPDREISDKGRSAFHGANRAEGGALYEFERQVEKGFYRNGAVFICEHFDRISRQGWEEVHAFLKLCVENGVSVATIDADRYYPAGQRIDGGTIMELVFKSEGAREESNKKSKRGLFNWSEKVKAIEAGDRKTKIGLPPGWMDRDPSTNIAMLNPHRTAVLQEIFDLYVEGHGLPSIVAKLNARKEPSWAVGGKDKGNGWNTAYLHKLLTNRAVLGEYVPMSRTHSGINEVSKGLRIADHYPQAISAELFDRVQAVRSQRRFTGGPSQANVSNLFSGSAYCRECGAPMYFQSQQKAGRPTGHKSKLDGRKLSYVSGVNRSYLKCNNNRRNHNCGNNKTFRYEALEPAILDAVLAVAIDDKKFTLPDYVAELSANVVELQRLVDGKRHNLQAIVDNLGEHFIKALAIKAQEIEAEVEADEARLVEMQNELAMQRGSANPQEHLRRVLEVKNSINSEDADARYSARVRVKQALAFLTKTECDAQGIATVRLQNGLMAWQFDQQGNMVGEPVDLRNRLDLHKGLPGPAKLIDEVRNRMEEAPRPVVDASQQQWKTRAS
jgi:DNA invertase Pin-like site-specific DNA recombinase